MSSCAVGIVRLCSSVASHEIPPMLYSESESFE